MKTGSALQRGRGAIGGDGTEKGRARLPLYLRLLVLAVLALLLSAGGSWLTSQVNMQVFPGSGSMFDAMVLLAVIAYILLMAIPFMPAIEVGIGLMLLLGSKGAVLAYACTLIALSISFLLGRVVPARVVGRLFRWLHLFKAGKLIAELEPLNHQERLELLHAKAPSRLTPFLLRHRYLAIAIALNIPGNALIGGGGGIGLIAGMSMIIRFHIYLAVLAVAIAPLPLSFFLYGDWLR